MPSAGANTEREARVGPAARPRERHSGLRACYSDGARALLRRRAWLASRRGRSRLGRSARVSAYCLSLVLLSAVSIVVPLARQASAQTTVTVPDGEDLATCATCTPANGTSTPVAGDVWQLESNAILTSQKQLPSTLTIIGATGGSTITLNNGSATASPTLFGYFVGPTSSSTTTLALSNVTITGANNVGGNTVGGAISGPFTQSLTIPITGSVTFSNNTVTGGGSGGAAIYTGNGGMTPSPGSVSIENTDQASSNSVTFSNNTVTGTGSGGGAISARGSVSIGTSASPVASVTLTGNTASNYFGGGIYATPSTVAGSPPARYRFTATK